ncbi:MAG: ABC transporter permease [Clostridium argentinense]|uniref:ABC transporter permease n=1 Tax=Clostridium faecium TaxID=2762223 RepID=A0ABR8YRS2_9CLOT|nr:MULTISPECIES: ABC transporter permease [Clostridium]MBD8046924.1 ABC transporter permease [Clostridium faecium]MBS5822331.1 ABC transporter permease [Clostridium argentinense]MDU1348493.1 ABC transporter permease [Clostridium argentinense]
MGLLINVLEQGFIFSIMAIGVYITYRILDFPDLSVEGTFPLGASVAAVSIINGINPFIACLLAFISGSIGGVITGLLHVKLKITNLMSGILVMIALYSINLRIMGKSNIPLFGENTIFTSVSSPIVIIAASVVVLKIILDLFLKTKLGFILKATGDNEQLVTSLGVNKDVIKIIGLLISNGLVALSGAIMAQYQGFADVGMGTGIVVMGLAAVIIGESILKKINIVKGTTMAVLGSVIYKAIIAVALELGFQPTDLKLVTVIIVVIALSLNNGKFSFKIRKKSVAGGEILVTDK